jgi:hypothetical protein
MTNFKPTDRQINLAILDLMSSHQINSEIFLVDKGMDKTVLEVLSSSNLKQLSKGEVTIHEVVRESVLKVLEQK